MSVLEMLEKSMHIRMWVIVSLFLASESGQEVVVYR